jgi:large subunit ribosomal protein L15
MKAHELNVSSHRQARRVGRGISAGQGKTAGRGTKGYGARAGSTRKPGFEGGQNPLMKRLPKVRGFKSKRTPMDVVYTGKLADVKGTVDNFSLFEAGLVANPYTRVKLVVRGDLAGKHTVKLQAASASAIEAIKKAGGSFTKTPTPKQPKSKND